MLHALRFLFESCWRCEFHTVSFELRSRRKINIRVREKLNDTRYILVSHVFNVLNNFCVQLRVQYFVKFPPRVELSELIPTFRNWFRLVGIGSDLSELVFENLSTFRKRKINSRNSFSQHFKICQLFFAFRSDQPHDPLQFQKYQPHLRHLHYDYGILQKSKITQKKTSRQNDNTSHRHNTTSLWQW